MKKNLRIVITIAILIILIKITTTFAADITELKEKRQEVQQQIIDNNVQLEEIEGQVSDLMLEIQELNDKIYSHEVEVAVLNSQIEELNVKINDVEKQLETAEERYERQKNLLSDRIVAQYEAGETVYLDVLLESNGLMEFISNYYLIEEIMEYDNEMLNDFEMQKEKIKTAKDELETYQKELKGFKEKEETSAIVLSNMKVVKNNQMAKLEKRELELQQEIEIYQEEVQKIEIELLMLLTANIGEQYTGGALAWPVPGYTRISSNYGMRIHPISGVYKLHTGLDIAAPEGAYFLAANDGKVVKAVYSESYGNMVVIDHGGGVSTLYAHGSQILVKEGDEVVRGQAVLRVGSTGYSTGPHAHFEVRINGRYVNPLDYILSSNTNKVSEEENNE